MTRPRILITGSSGLIGCALRRALRLSGYETNGLDLRGVGPEQGDVRDMHRVQQNLQGCVGVVHLAAVSRIVIAEADPGLCWSVNVEGFRTVVRAAEQASQRPWLIFASSREVYGRSANFPVSEDSALCPVNVYGRSKVEAERQLSISARGGMRAAIARFSNVYGSVDDHHTRVVPAFSKAAATGGIIRVEGEENAFDFTHLDDTVSGLLALIGRISSDDFHHLLTLQFVTGQMTSLGELARLAASMAREKVDIIEVPSRSFDVGKFCGNRQKAFDVLGWSPQVDLPVGLTRLIDAFARIATPDRFS